MENATSQGPLALGTSIPNDCQGLQKKNQFQPQRSLRVQQVTELSLKWFCGWTPPPRPNRPTHWTLYQPQRGINSPLNRQEAGEHSSLASRLFILPLPPELPHTMRPLPLVPVCSPAHRGFQVLCLVSEMVQVFPSGQDSFHILGHDILDSLHLTLQVPNSVISGTPTGVLLDVNTGVN